MREDEMWAADVVAAVLLILPGATPPLVASATSATTRPAAGVAGQASVGGVVRSSEGTALPHVRVTLVATGRGTTTGRDGRFVLHNLAPGTHRVEFTLIGYRPTVEEVRVTAEGGTAGGAAVVRLDVVLEPTPLSLPGVQVTATPAGRDALLVARPTTQLAGAALERSMGSSVAQTLATQPGMAVRYNGPAAAAPVIRGLTGDRILILQDGQRTSDLSGSADDHSVTVDPLSAQRIEVVRGPASLLYGTNALGGVVNVITGDIALHVPERSQWTASLHGESAYPGASASVRGVMPVTDQWALMVRGGGRSTGDTRIGRDPELGSRLDNTFHRNAGGAAGAAYSGPRISGGASVLVYGLEHGVPLPPDEHGEIMLRGRRGSVSARLEAALGSALFPSLRVQGMATDYAHDELEDGEVAMAFGLRTQGVDAVLRQGPSRLGSEGAWGVSILQRQYSATGEDQLTAPADARTYGAFGYQELQLAGTGASLQAGARVDRYMIQSHDDPHFGDGVRRGLTAYSGSIGVSVPLAPATSLSLSAARSFRAPTVEELFSGAFHIGTASFEIGDPLLEPEVARGMDAVLRVAGRRVHAEIAAYVNRIDDFIHFEARGDTTVGAATWPVLAYVQDRADFVGAEGSVQWLLSRRWVAGVQGDIVRGSMTDGAAIPFLPAARVGGTLRWSGGPWTASAGTRHAFRQDRVGVGDEPADACTLVDLDAGLRIVRGGRIHSVTLRAENAGNRLYREATSRIRDFAPNPGRNVGLLYRVSF
jgi:iron complex outermembrane recepter protein